MYNNGSGLLELMQRRARLKKKLRNWTKDIKSRTGREPSAEECEQNKPMLLEYQQVKNAIENLMNQEKNIEEEKHGNDYHSKPPANTSKDAINDPSVNTVTSSVENWFSNTSSAFGGFISSMGIDSSMNPDSTSSKPSGATQKAAADDDNGPSWLSSIWNDIPSTSTYSASLGDWFGEGSGIRETSSLNTDNAFSGMSLFFSLGESSPGENNPADEASQPSWFTRWVESSLRKEDQLVPTKQPAMQPAMRKEVKRKLKKKSTKSVKIVDEATCSIPSVPLSSKTAVERQWAQSTKLNTLPQPEEVKSEEPSQSVNFTPEVVENNPRLPMQVAIGVNDGGSIGGKDNGGSRLEEHRKKSEEEDEDEEVEEEEDEEDNYKKEVNEKFMRLKDEAMLKFNLNAKKGVEFVIEQGMIPSRHPKYISEFLFHTRGLNKTQIGEYLGDPNSFNLEVLQFICKLFKFQNLSFSAAIRKFLRTFRLPGEAQKIDRILEAFAEAYYEANHQEGTMVSNKEDFQFSSPSTAHILAFSIIMLNTDAHNPSMAKKDKMTREQFIRNNRGIDDGEDLPREMLEDIYDDITSNEILTSVDDGNDSGVELFSNPAKEGWMDKMGGHVGANLLQQWRSRYFILSGNRLYYFKEVRDVNPLGCIVLVDVTAEVNNGKSLSRSNSKLNQSSSSKVPAVKNNQLGLATTQADGEESVLRAKEWNTDLIHLTQLMMPKLCSNPSGGRRSTLIQSVRRGTMLLSRTPSFAGEGRLETSATSPLPAMPCSGKHITFKGSGEKLGIFLKSRGTQELPIVDDILFEIPLLKKGDVLVCLDNQPLIDMSNPISEILFKLKQNRETDCLPVTLTFIEPETESMVRKHSPLIFRKSHETSAVVYGETSSTNSSKGYLEIIPSFGGKINSVRYNEQGQVVPGTHETVKLQLKSTRLAESWAKAINEATIHTSGAI